MASPVRRTPTVFPYRGKWRLTYIDSDGNERSRTAGSREQAYRLLFEISESRSGERTQIEIPTLREWWDYWVAHYTDDLRRRSVANIQYLMRKHVLPALGDAKLDQISHRNIEALYRDLLNRKGLAPSTVQRAHSALSVPLQRAVREGIISVNPMSLVVKPRAPKPRAQALTAPQRQALWNVIQDLSVGEQLRWVLAVKFGLRQSEALGLRVEDCDPDLKVLSIRRQLQRIPLEGWVFTPPKSAQGIRDIPLDDHTVDLFIEAVRGLPEGCELVFPNPDGSPRHASTDRKAWLRLLKKAGIPAVSLHTARHTAATVMITSGVDVKTVQMVLGHSTPAFTLATYVHPSIDDLRRSLSRIF